MVSQAWCNGCGRFYAHAGMPPSLRRRAGPLHTRLRLPPRPTFGTSSRLILRPTLVFWMLLLGLPMTKIHQLGASWCRTLLLRIFEWLRPAEAIPRPSLLLARLPPTFFSFSTRPYVVTSSSSLVSLLSVDFLASRSLAWVGLALRPHWRYRDFGSGPSAVPLPSYVYPFDGSAPLVHAVRHVALLEASCEVYSQLYKLPCVGPQLYAPLMRPAVPRAFGYMGGFSRGLTDSPHRVADALASLLQFHPEFSC